MNNQEQKLPTEQQKLPTEGYKYLTKKLDYLILTQKNKSQSINMKIRREAVRQTIVQE